MSAYFLVRFHGPWRAMTEALSLVPPADLDVLAYWAANLNAK